MKVKKHLLIRTMCLFLVIIAIVVFSNLPSEHFLIMIFKLILGWNLIILTINGLREKTLFNPFILFAFTPLSLLLYDENISDYYFSTLDERTWLLGVINIIAFSVGLVIFLDRKNKQDNYCREEFSNIKSLTTHTIIMLVIGMMPLVFYLLMKVQMPFASIISYFRFLALAGAWKSKRIPLLYFVNFVILLSYFFSFNKTAFLGYALITLICYQKYFSNSKKRKLFFYLIGSILAILFLFVAFPLKDIIQNGSMPLSFNNLLHAIRDYANNTNDYYVGRIFWKGPNVLRFPYIYLVSGWNNVQYVMETQSIHTYGLWCIKPLLSLLQLDGFFSKYYELLPKNSFNTFTFVTVLYKDFGIVLSCIVSCFLAFFVGNIYLKFKKSNSIFYVAVWAVVAQAEFEMFFSNHFFMLSYPFTIILLCYVYKTLLKSSKLL